MAIEFNCPYCTSTIRVPDNASGKKGTCPRCDIPIMVPVIEQQPAAPAESPANPPVVETPPPAAIETPPPPTVSPPPTEQPLGFGEVAPNTEPVFPGPPTTAAGDLSSFDPTTVVPSEPTPSYAKALKRRRKKKGIGVVIPIVFGVALMGVVIFIWLQSQPSLNGELTAETLLDYQLVTGGVGKSDVEDLPKEVIDYVLEDLEQNPARLTSGLMETEFRGTPTGIEVRVYEGKQTAFFRVAPHKNKDFADWVTKNSQALGKPRTKQFASAVNRFFAEYDETQGDLPDLVGYRDSLGLTATVSRVGFNMVAIVGGKSYRCVFEDDKQRLYFLLPRKTRQFELEGRKLDNGETVFPGHYNVKVE